MNLNIEKDDFFELEEIKYYILVTLERNNKKFIYYTDYSKDEKEHLKIYVSIYDGKSLVEIVDKEDVEFVNNYIEILMYEIENV